MPLSNRPSADLHPLSSESLEEFAPPFDTAKRQQIMDGARRVFLEDGFDGASIGDVVRAAGVSKGTLYAYFPSKERLFQALVIEDRRKQAEVICVLDEGIEDPANVLFKLGFSFLQMLAKPDTLAFLRIVIATAPKFPEIGRAFYEAGPAHGHERLGSYLRKLAGEGVLTLEDPELAARQFFDLCKSGILLRMLLAQLEAPSEAEIKQNVENALKVFFAAYGRKE